MKSPDGEINSLCGTCSHMHGCFWQHNSNPNVNILSLQCAFNRIPPIEITGGVEMYEMRKDELVDKYCLEALPVDCPLWTDLFDESIGVVWWSEPQLPN